MLMPGDYITRVCKECRYAIVDGICLACLAWYGPAYVASEIPQRKDMIAKIKTMYAALSETDLLKLEEQSW